MATGAGPTGPNIGRPAHEKKSARSNDRALVRTAGSVCYDPKKNEMPPESST